MGAATNLLSLLATNSAAAFDVPLYANDKVTAGKARLDALTDNIKYLAPGSVVKLATSQPDLSMATGYVIPSNKVRATQRLSGPKGRGSGLSSPCS